MTIPFEGRNTLVAYGQDIEIKARPSTEKGAVSAFFLICPLVLHLTLSRRQCLFQQLMQRSEFRLADIALEDLAVLVDHERGRRQLHIAEGLGDVAFGVERDLERQAARLRIVEHVVAQKLTITTLPRNSCDVIFSPF